MCQELGTQQSIKQDFIVPFCMKTMYRNTCAWKKNVWKVNSKLLTVSNLGKEKQGVNAMKVCSFDSGVFTVFFFSTSIYDFC